MSQELTREEFEKGFAKVFSDQFKSNSTFREFDDNDNIAAVMDSQETWDFTISLEQWLSHDYDIIVNADLDPSTQTMGEIKTYLWQQIEQKQNLKIKKNKRR